MPTPSPPKRQPNFGQKTVHESETGTEVDFSMDGSSVRDYEDGGPFDPASPQTAPPKSASGKPKKGKKKKKAQLI